jgi:hypothetical protein
VNGNSAFEGIPGEHIEVSKLKARGETMKKPPTWFEVVPLTEVPRKTAPVAGNNPF